MLIDENMYGFGILSNKFHKFGFGSDIVVVVMGDKQHVSLSVDRVIELSGLDKFVQ